MGLFFFCGSIEEERRKMLNDYQEAAKEFDLFRRTGDYNTVAFIEKVLGLVGEAGETADKVKKILRDKEGMISEGDKREVVKELGDVLWYVAMIAEYLEVPLKEVAETNIEKLRSRKQRNLLHGAGDNR